jgi:hypothetical protein
VPLAERAAARVLAGQPDPEAVGDERGERGLLPIAQSIGCGSPARHLEALLVS